MKRVRVDASRRDLETDSGEIAQELANYHYDYRKDLSGQYYDGGRNTGARIEVKSTFRVIGNNHQTKGRFRIPKNQHDRLVRYDRKQSSYYIFVLFDSNTQKNIPQEAVLKRIKPKRVGRLIGSMGGFESSGHSSYSKEKKLIWTAIFDI